ncbi:hypothetical protein EJB05_31843 [Eragrostis curvula]|uniref:RING-type E3 ubiquitin transferase n=1 Tax=Eragrostis curvula TaxID=38414 RepID=A0A5J9UFX4_9POAL|nr:hypothetical protein EJB05_31843 [Eragrostis curvula]
MAAKRPGGQLVWGRSWTSHKSLSSGCVKRPRPAKSDTAAATNRHGGALEKITVAIDPELLECGVCFGPLVPPLFQCTKGHISCSECCTDGAMDDDDSESECMMCRKPETATRCRAMERVLDGLSVPCAFRQHGCTQMIPYADKKDHAASCAYAPCYCPIAGCAGDYVGALRAGEMARVVSLGNFNGKAAEFLLVVGRGVPSWRALSVIRLVDGALDKGEFKYRIEVVGEAGVLSLSGQAKRVERLTTEYKASAFLFVPDAIWDATPEDVPCTKGHISCSECCNFGAMHHECLMCREPETATRCRAMERVLDGLSVPCAFRQNGCTEMIPYAEKQDHAASCAHAPRHCPIAGCNGYNYGGSLLGHIELDHPDVRRTHVTSDFLNALGMREGEIARVLLLGNGRAQFLLVVGRGLPSGRTLSVIHLVEEPLDVEDFEYTVKVAGEATVLSLCDRAEGVKHLTKPYQANVFLFVPNAIWDAAPDNLEVFIELKSLK